MTLEELESLLTAGTRGPFEVPGMADAKIIAAVLTEAPRMIARIRELERGLIGGTSAAQSIGPRYDQLVMENLDLLRRERERQEMARSIAKCALALGGILEAGDDRPLRVALVEKLRDAAREMPVGPQ